jgi:IPT/TIG domain
MSSSSLTLIQGNSSSPVNITIDPINGFTGTVQVTLSGIPSGVTTSPATPLSIAGGQSAAVVFGAAPNATAGTFNLTAQGTSGSLSHSAPLALSIQASAASNLSRSVFLRNDSVPVVDMPPGEPPRREVVYDSAGSRFFVANSAMNRVEVYSDQFPSLTATIDAPTASSVDLSPDGSTLWIGTRTEQLLAVSTSNLQISARYPMAGLAPIPGAVFIRPTEALALSSGKIALRLRQSSASESLLALWDPASNTATNLTSSAPAVFQNGLGVMARSGDHTRFLVAANDASGEVALFDSNANLLAGPQPIGSGSITAVAANSNGTQFAVLLNANGAQQVLLLNAQLGVTASYSSTNAASLLFSPGGQSLYVAESFSNSRVITALAAANLQKIGQVPDLAVQGIPTTLEDSDSSKFLLGLGNRGVAALDVSSPATLSTPGPAFASAPVASPAEGPNTGGTSITLSGSNFSSAAQIRFGSQTPLNAGVSGATQLQIASPSSAVPGPVNLIAYFSNGWLAAAPDAFTYGPTVLKVLPNAASSAGGATVHLIGHGFGSSTGAITVTIGGQSAAIQSVQALPAFAPTLGLDSTYPFPLECITLTTPAGTPGKADISTSTPAGSATLAKSFQFLAPSQTFPNPPLYKFIAYDQSRQQLYLSATDHVDVFNLSTQAFGSPIEPPPNGPLPDAGLRGMALTPDGTQLIVADFGAQNVYLINPDGAAYNGSSVNVGGVAGYLNSGPSRVAATSAQTVFVGLSGEGGSASSCNNCLGQMNLTAFPPTYEPAPQPEVTSVTGAPLLQADQAGDSVYLAFSSSPGGPLASWSASAPNAFTLSTAKDLSTDLSSAASGAMFAVRSNGATEIRDANLVLTASPPSAELENIPGRVAVPGIALHPSGALVYDPWLDGPPPAAPPATGIHGGVDIRDAHSGRLRLRIYLPEPFAMLNTDVDGLHGAFLTVDENGQRLFALTTSGLTVVKLAAVPLGIGSLSPANGPSAGGTSVTLTGSGFQSGTTAMLGGKSLTVVFKDMNTVTFTTPALASGAQQLVLTNPDGESVSLDAAFLAQ